MLYCIPVCVLYCILCSIILPWSLQKFTQKFVPPPKDKKRKLKDSDLEVSKPKEVKLDPDLKVEELSPKKEEIMTQELKLKSEV